VPMSTEELINSMDVSSAFVASMLHHIINGGREPVHPPPFIYDLIHDCLLGSHSPHSQCLSSFILAIACAVRISDEARMPLICWIVSLRSSTHLLRRSDTFRISFSISVISRIVRSLYSPKPFPSPLRPPQPKLILTYP
jgi:hypothetical protein